jgi:hypothetical protein
MVGGLELAEVGDHERVARHGREFLDDADDAERDDVEVTGAVALLVPALVAIMGGWNWWMPYGFGRPLRLAPTATADDRTETQTEAFV